VTENAPPGADIVAEIEGRRKLHPLWLVLKTAISLGLIVVVLWKLDLATIWEKTRQLSVGLMLSVVSLFVVQTCVAARRWGVILHHHHVDIRVSAALRICFIGAFFNQILPSSIGGDVARAWYVYRSGGNKMTSVMTVLSDRIYGMLALTALALIVIPVLSRYSIGNRALYAVIALVVAASFSLLTVFWLDHLPKWMKSWTFIRHLGSLSAAVRGVAADGDAVLPLLALSFLIHIITVLAIVIFLAAVAPQSNLILCAALVPTIMLVAMVPVSIAGWGVRESVMIYGLGLAGVEAEAALVVSILVGLSLAAVGLLGGLIWVIQINSGNSQAPR
jgi:uncharacterized protein (TIRG00374 family)